MREAEVIRDTKETKISFKLIGDCDITLTSTNEKVVDYLNARESHFKILIQQFIHLIGFKVLIAAGLLFGRLRFLVPNGERVASSWVLTSLTSPLGK